MLIIYLGSASTSKIKLILNALTLSSYLNHSQAVRKEVVACLSKGNRAVKVPHYRQAVAILVPGYMETVF